MSKRLNDKLTVEDNWEVVLGEHNQYLKDFGEQIAKPEKFFIHPGFNFSETYTVQNDIALIQLKEAANLTTFVDLIPISNNTRLKDDTECKVGGWGQLASAPYGWGMFIPLKTTVYVINNNTCDAVYKEINFTLMTIDESVLCAGIPEGKQSQHQKDHDGLPDACQGDSGSPLLCPTGRNDEYEVVGIVSTGNGCGTAKYPGIYVKAAYYAEWIAETMENN